MNKDHNAYCCDFNEQGYCKTCGATRDSDSDEPRTVEPFHLNGNWPSATWFQRRKAHVALKTLKEVK